MYEKEQEVVNKIQTQGLAIGVLADEAVKSATDGRYMAALSCLFVLAEQSVKQASQVTSGNFQRQILSLLKDKKISFAESSALDDLRNIRNKIFHENHYMYAVVDKNNRATMLSEHEGKEQLWNKLSLPILIVCNRIIAE